MPALRCRQHSRAGLGSRHLRRIFDGRGCGPTVRLAGRADHAGPQSRRHAQHGIAADAGRRTFGMERLRLRQRVAERRVCRDAGGRRTDRTRAAVRGRHGLFQASVRAVRHSQARRTRKRRRRLHDQADVDQVLARRVPFAKRHLCRLAIAQADSGLRKDCGDRSVLVRRVGRHHRQRSGKMAAQNARDRRSQPAILHGRGSGRWRRHARVVQPRAARR